MSTYIILDTPTDHHFGSLYLNKVAWMDRISIDYVFGMYDDYNPNIFRQSEHINYLSKSDLKLVLNVAFLPMVVDIVLNDKTKKLINTDPNTYLWILCPHEYLLDIEKVKVECKQKGINFEKVIVTSCNADKEIIDEGILCIGIDDWHEARYRFNVRAFSNIGFIHPIKKQSTLDSTTKKYICLLRNNKEHRISLYYYLNKYNLIDQGYISYYCPKIGMEGFSSESIDVKLDWAEYNRYLKTEELEVAKNAAYMWKVKELDELDNKIKDNNRKTIEPFYHDSLISIVSESQMFGVFNTEKTFKAITHCHPFVIQGNNLMIDDLKKKGYKTYENIFGVSNFYDYTETEDFLIHIKNTPHKRLLLDIKKNWSQVVYNYNHFMTRPIYMNTTINKIKKKLKRK